MVTGEEGQMVFQYAVLKIDTFFRLIMFETHFAWHISKSGDGHSKSEGSLVFLMRIK